MALRVLPLREAKARLSAVVDECQKNRVLIVRHGRPAAILIGVAGRELRELLLEFDQSPQPLLRARKRV